MLGCIVEHMAALAERGEIAGHIVARIMIEMRASQDHVGCADASQVQAIPDDDPPATFRPPEPGVGVPPASVTKMRDEA
ncbi:hypothetical protein C8J40_1197 [Sphingomonas sp. PP-CC-3A-396]|nr:hypothetical protein C8J40_1197 [Sphingomonas sp. PP-CC-3A-396]